jgi:hypothetical protein
VPWVRADAVLAAGGVVHEATPDTHISSATTSRVALGRVRERRPEGDRTVYVMEESCERRTGTGFLECGHGPPLPR